MPLKKCKVFINKYVTFFSGTTETYLRKSKGMSEQSIETITTSDNIFAPSLVNSDPLPDAKLNSHCLIIIISIPKKVINL